MLFVDAKYASLVGSRIKNFKSKGQHVWQYTCPYCSDWSSEKIKARAYIYRKKTDLFTKCHHCGHGSNIGNLIKHFDEDLYKQYVIERYSNNVSKYSDHKDISPMFQPSKELSTELTDDILSPLQRIDTLEDTHFAKLYARSRMISEEQEKLFYFTSTFKQYTNNIVKKFTNLENDHPRLIIPYFNSHGKVIHYNARAFGDEEPKYMMIRINEDAEKVYGLDRVDYSKPIYATEGEVDSLMLDNAVAVGGAASFLSVTMQKLKSNLILIHDNEPRSKEVCKIVAKTVDEGYNCFLPPETFPFKDLNAAIIGGVSKTELKQLIDDNCFQGMKAKLRMTTWKKC